MSLHLARVAAQAGAEVLAVTTRRDGTLAQLADPVLVVDAPRSGQFGGSLFEQAALLLLDAIVLDLTDGDATAHALMQARHTNLQ